MVSSSRRHESGSGLEPAGADPGYVYPKDEFDVDDWGGPVGAHRAARKGWLVALPWLVGAAVILLLTGVALSLGLGRNKADEAAVAAPTKSVTVQASPTVTSTGSATTVTSDQTRAAGTATTGTSTATATSDAPTAATTGSTATSSTATASSSDTGSASGAVNKQTRIQILNSTRRNGVAHRLQSTMRANGWNVTSVDTYRKRPLPTVVYYRNPADRATAQAVAALYGVGVRQSSGWTVPVTLMLGNDFRS